MKKSLGLSLCLLIVTLSSYAISVPVPAIYGGGEPDEMPRFPGCEAVETPEGRKSCSYEKLILFMQKNIKYPAEAKKNRTEGKVIVTFKVEKDGTIKEAAVKSGIGNGCDKEALRVINVMPKWIPGTKDGQPVAVEMALPIMFKDK